MVITHLQHIAEMLQNFYHHFLFFFRFRCGNTPLTGVIYLRFLHLYLLAKG